MTPAIKSGSTFAWLTLKRSSMIPWRVIPVAPVDAPVFVNQSADFRCASSACRKCKDAAICLGPRLILLSDFECRGLRVSATLAAISRRCSSDRKGVARNQAASPSDQPSLPFLSLLICLFLILRRNSPRRRSAYEAAASPTNGYAIPQERRPTPSRKVAIGARRTKLVELLGLPKSAWRRVPSGLASSRLSNFRVLEAGQPHYGF